MDKRLLILPALLATLAAPAQAEPSSRVAWTPETLALVKAGNTGHGQELAKNLGCDGCHTGSTMPDAPHLAGQLATYLYRQLHDYKDRSRANDTMEAMAAGLSEQDMADLSAWYGKQEASAATPAQGA
ncbi:c-type cytochrome, partial [Methylogaea oryzae]